MLLKLGAWVLAAALAVSCGVGLVVSMHAPAKSAPPPAPSPVEAAITPDEGSDSYERFAHADPEPEPEPVREPEPEPEDQQRTPPEPQRALAGEPLGPMPKPGEAGPRSFTPDPGAALTLTLPSLGVRNAPVYGSDSPEALEAGVGHVPETSLPWTRSPHRNTYLAAHRLGYPGTGSRLLFYELDKLRRGDEVVLKGRGETYRYRVSEILVVGPLDSWVMGQVVGRDMVTLQTCTPIPTFEKRLIVRADRI